MNRVVDLLICYYNVDDINDRLKRQSFFFAQLIKRTFAPASEYISIHNIITVNSIYTGYYR
jgi:hypothetical protein